MQPNNIRRFSLQRNFVLFTLQKLDMGSFGWIRITLDVYDNCRPSFRFCFFSSNLSYMSDNFQPVLYHMWTIISMQLYKKCEQWHTILTPHPGEWGAHFSIKLYWLLNIIFDISDLYSSTVAPHILSWSKETLIWVVNIDLSYSQKLVTW